MAQITYSDLLAFSEKCQNAQAAEDIVRPFDQLLAKHGIISWFVGSLGFISDWKGFGYDKIPEDWRRHYVEQSYYNDDAVYHHARRGGEKGTRAEIRRGAANQSVYKRGNLVAQEAAAFGLSNGLMMPIHGYGDLPAAVSYGGHDLDLSDDAQASLYVVGAFAYESLRRLSQETMPVPPHLTDNELRVLRWTAQGKSATDIAVILRLSPHTVREYHSRLRQKYDVSTNIQVVVYAGVDGQLKRAASL